MRNTKTLGNFLCKVIVAMMISCCACRATAADVEIYHITDVTFHNSYAAVENVVHISNTGLKGKVIILIDISGLSERDVAVANLQLSTENGRTRLIVPLRFEAIAHGCRARFVMDEDLWTQAKLAMRFPKGAVMNAAEDMVFLFDIDSYPLLSPGGEHQEKSVEIGGIGLGPKAPIKPAEGRE